MAVTTDGERVAEMVGIEALAERPAVRRALRHIGETDARTLADQVAVAGIPAPPLAEADRARWMRGRFSELGLHAVETDAAGNVLGTIPGADPDAAPVLLSAHLDTVFDADTTIEIRQQENGAWTGPGIADDARGLAAILAIGRALREAGVQPRRSIVLVATVGEEGRGDLRGVRHLFREGSRWRDAAAFISLDGAGNRRIVVRAVGSRRLRITVNGPGGHSWADWGLANPLEAVSAAVADLARVPLPRRPRTVLSVGTVRGGTSVNSIPSEAVLELDLRSESADALAELERRVTAILDAALEATNRRRRRDTEPLTMAVQVIGDRPTGELPADSPLVRAAARATEWTGGRPELVASSTDANVPLSLGVPAIALGAGGETGGTHTPAEWYRNDGGAEGVQRALLTVLALTGIVDAG